MKRLVTAEQMRQADAASGQLHGMPAAILMENAGAALALAALELACADGRIVVLCGRGNNGGDGLVAARWLHARGRQVWVEVVGGADGLADEPSRNLRALRAAGLEPSGIGDELRLGRGDVVIDALLGTGLTRPAQGPYARAIERIGAWRADGARILAADLPSGLEADTGQPLPPCVQADLTLSFGLLKLGQLLEPGRSLCGELRQVEIGLPPSAVAALGPPHCYQVEEQDVRALLAPRRADAHKGSFGHVLVVAGSAGKTGAAAMVGLGALRAGAGLVTVATRPDALAPVLAHAPELMGFELAAGGGLGPADLTALLEAAEGKDAVVVGPGIPRGEQTSTLLATLLEALQVPCVLDADALNALADMPAAFGKARCPLILTPHPREMSRLVGQSTSQIQADRPGQGRALAQAHGVIVVLKGAGTLVCLPDGVVYLNPTGNPGMATGGTGDVLAGILGGFLAQGLTPKDAAIAGVWVHGLAGDLAAKTWGQRGLIATDLLTGLGQVWARWGR
jgi:ADP-dependent NAD(P)H-hydrate dehydratase / NAD(P)H-hydrate epimerase